MALIAGGGGHGGSNKPKGYTNTGGLTLALMGNAPGPVTTSGEAPPSPTKALIDQLAKLTAEKLARQKREREGGKSQKKKDEESSSDDEDYPPDPQQCQVSGKGFAGDHSGQPVKLNVHIKDVRGKRMKEGGEDVTVRVQYHGTGEYLSVEVTDNDNGTYTAVYTPPAKGHYSVTVEINGVPIAGSPFPVFFSTPVDPAILAAEQEAEQKKAEAAAAAAQGAGAAAGADAAAAQPGSVSVAAAAGVSAVQGLGDENLRTLYVGNISPLVPFDRLRDLFNIFGTVLELSPVGDAKDMAVVIFATKEAQSQGQQLNGTMFGDRQLHVTAPMSAMAAGVIPAHPTLAMQMQQIQNMQQTLIQSQKLAAQVAQMRAHSKTGLMVREDPEKAAQDALARLTAKLAGGGSRIANELAAAGAAAAAAAANAKIDAQQQAQAQAAQDSRDDRGKDKHSSRKHHDRDRSRSPRRRSPSRERDRDRDRDRRVDRDRHDRDYERRERERREYDRRQRERWEQDRERERQRARDRDRDRHREHDRDRDTHVRDRGHHHHHDRERDTGRDRDRDREEDRRRGHSRERERERQEADRRDRDRDRDRSRERHRSDKDKHSRHAKEEPRIKQEDEANGALGSASDSEREGSPERKVTAARKQKSEHDKREEKKSSGRKRRSRSASPSNDSSRSE